MKKQYIIGVCILGIILALITVRALQVKRTVPTHKETASSTHVVSPDSTVTLDDGAYLVVPEESSVRWTAGKPAVADYVHTGSFAVQTGAATVSDGGITGTFTIDMNSLRILSLGGGEQGKESALETHLKSEAFFDVGAFPTATFVITEITPKIVPNSGQTSYVAQGELTMRGVTNKISFPIAIESVSSHEARVFAKFSIDRTAWNVSFGSAKVTQAVANQIIGDTVGLELTLTVRQ